MSTYAEENYLKAIYKLSRSERDSVATNSIAELLQTQASSVTDMIKKLADKKWVNYRRYQGVTLTNKGKVIAVSTIRKHRLWEVFLVNHLNFKWDEVHDFAEQLEHIESEELINRLEEYLNYPKFDPHGDPIPDREGNIQHHHDISLSDLEPGESGVIVGLKEHSNAFLQFLEESQMRPGTEIQMKNIFAFDNSMNIIVNGKEKMVSEQVGKNLYVRKVSNK